MSYHESCQAVKGYIIPGFKEKLALAEELAEIDADGNYHLDGVSWPKNLKDQDGYPSEFFYRMIMSLVAKPLYPGSNKLYLVNPPPLIDHEHLTSIIYLPIHRNILMILDGLYHQGGKKGYVVKTDTEIFDGLYSEHYGGIIVNNETIEDVVVSALKGRRYDDDPSIIMPAYAQKYAKYSIIFHTHPNTEGYFGRMRQGVVYDCPSGQDYYCFCMCRLKGKTQIMIIIAPEGTYVMRPIDYRKPSGILDNTKEPSSIVSEYLQWVQKIEKSAVNHFHELMDETDSDMFHEKISQDYRVVQALNAYSAPYNIWLEYYPRIQKTYGEQKTWSLTTIIVPYLRSESY
jgi:hypothetical protein